METTDIYINYLKNKATPKPVVRYCGICRYKEGDGHAKVCRHDTSSAKNRFMPHYPHGDYDNEAERSSVYFDTNEELFEVDMVKRWSMHKDFYRYSISDNHLMAEYIDGKKWWVIGYIKYPEKLNLPKWEPKK